MMCGRALHIALGIARSSMPSKLNMPQTEGIHPHYVLVHGVYTICKLFTLQMS